MLDLAQTIWEYAERAGPFAALVCLGVAYLSEKNRRATIRAIVAKHEKELALRDARIDEHTDQFKSLLEQTTGIDLSG